MNNFDDFTFKAGYPYLYINKHTAKWLIDGKPTKESVLKNCLVSLKYIFSEYIQRDKETRKIISKCNGKKIFFGENKGSLCSSDENHRHIFVQPTAENKVNPNGYLLKNLMFIKREGQYYQIKNRSEFFKLGIDILRKNSYKQDPNRECFFIDIGVSKQGRYVTPRIMFNPSNKAKGGDNAKNSKTSDNFKSN